MDSKSLMIGDWVKDKYRPKPHQVDSWADFNSAEDLSPISLTPEILKKNGFIQQPFFLDSKCDALSDDFCKNLPDLQVCVELDKYDPRFMVFHRNYQADDELDDNPTYYMDATWVLPLGESVHELQHALRLCGLTELADNFKI